jgi:hypothetical protein
VVRVGADIRADRHAWRGELDGLVDRLHERRSSCRRPMMWKAQRENTEATAGKWF